MTLIGHSTRQAGLFLDALQEMGTRGWGAARLPFQLEQVIDPIRNTLIWSGGKTWMRNCQSQPLPWIEKQAQVAVVRFHTPVRVLIKRELCTNLTFENIIQSISRRLVLLSQAYTDHTLHWDEDAVLQAARSVRTVEQQWRYIDFERYSMTRNGKLSLAAIEGWARYEGELTAFTPLLEAGQHIHLGKNATIGFGHYSVVYDR
ncbi:CRISPR system precrRNA processing endoribonuclease RAMP protein Cas6 [Cohnella hongkongensis]|uniref:CRISPR system precrRNA processing endoribonuclease RAMP protein Cas6 n=1 Tax=Cohnella hongkongensis TaxID=178337 RepID=A0ABV9FG71_9BACL